MLRYGLHPTGKQILLLNASLASIYSAIEPFNGGMFEPQFALNLMPSLSLTKVYALPLALLPRL